MYVEEHSPVDPVVQTCQDVFGIQYPFPWQRMVIAAVLDAFDTDFFERYEQKPEPLWQVAVLPTGAGKSLCWMLPAVMITGITVTVFPLLSLMSDQKRRLEQSGIASVTLKGGQSGKERQSIWKSLEDGTARVVLANPEVLQTPAVLERLGKLKPAFVVVDETHTVSQWGESFRPACADMGKVIKAWNPQAVLALTATADTHIIDRLKELVFNGQTPRQALANPDRPTIRYGAIPTFSRYHALERLVCMEQRPAIVFGPTRKSVQNAARVLRYRLQDTRIKFYHAGLSVQEKAELEKWFFDSQDGILCATCAYGMGVDKANVRSVIHLAPPSSMAAYLQETGRGSRDGKGASAWLIWSPQDINREHPMWSYVNAGRCRRQMLLEAMGAVMEDCNGCDVCGGEAWQQPPEERSILKLIRWHSGCLSNDQAARILVGQQTLEIRQSRFNRFRGFGSLAGWRLEDAEEAIHTLLQIGKLHYTGRKHRGRQLKLAK